MRWLPLLVVACGSGYPPPPAPAAPVPAPAKPLPPPAAVTCADAGVILRGSVEDSKKAGPTKEAAIASACMFDRWSQEILDCIGSQATPRGCLGKLTSEQRAALDTKMAAWTNIYEGEIWESAEDEEAALPEIDCTDVIGDVATYVPMVTVLGEERDFVLALRKQAVTAECEGWPRPVKQCLQDGGGIAACRAKLEPERQASLAGKLGEIDAMLAKIVAAKKKPHDCKAVVAAHYSDAAWKGKAEPPKNPKATRAELTKQAADRKDMIARSRKLMLDSCTNEAWNATLRACELSDGGELCARASGRARNRWTFPAAGVVVTTGVPECDAYQASIQALVSCGKLPQQSRDALQQSFDAMRERIINSKADQLATMAVACKQADDGIRQAAQALGCMP